MTVLRPNEPIRPFPRGTAAPAWGPAPRETLSLPPRVRSAKIVLQFAGGLGLATAAAAGFIFAAGAFALGLSGRDRAFFGSALLGGFGLAVAVASVVFGVLALVAGAGIARGDPGARTLGRIAAALMLPVLPVGTILGILVLAGLAGPEARAWFGAVPAPAVAAYRV